MQSIKLLNEKVDSFIPSIVCKLNIMLGVPHMPVFTQGDYSDEISLFYVGKGTGKVCIRDKRGKETMVRRLW